MRFFPFFLLAFPLFATVNEPFRWEVSTGYRNDRVHWHLQEFGTGGALTYEELYRGLQFWENGLNINTIHRDLVFSLEGSFAAFGRGPLSQKWGALDFTEEMPSFHFTTRGWAADTGGLFGYAVNLTGGRTYKVILVPFLGYSAHFERLKSRGGSPNPLESQNATSADSYSMVSTLPSKLHMTWYGVFFGGGFKVEPGGRLDFSCGYRYHLLKQSFCNTFQRQVSLFNPTLFNETSTKIRARAKGDGMGHSGWALFNVLLTTFWKMGLGVKIHYFSSEAITAKEKIQQSFILPPTGETENSIEEKYKMRWTSISGWLAISREF